jgi:phage FluMu protein Com
MAATQDAAVPADARCLRSAARTRNPTRNEIGSASHNVIRSRTRNRTVMGTEASRPVLDRNRSRDIRSSDGQELRCACGALLAVLCGDTLVIKCRRCKRSVAIPLAELEHGVSIRAE